MQDFVDLPPTYNPRTLQLAADMRRDPALAKADSAELVEAVLQRLRTGGYTYTLEPGVYGTHTADEFWFDKKEGFCEHIASSFVLLMRALDIPARIVTGYQGGEVNNVDGYWTVRQSDAHAWTEVWISGRGWVRVDPTSAVSPGRTGSFQRLQAPRNAVTQALAGALSPQVALNMRAFWDAANNRWNQWVLNYSQNKQLDLLRNIGFESPSWEDLSYVLIGIIVVVSLVGAAWTLWERHRQDPWLRLLHQAQRRLARAGLALPENTPPRQMADLLRQRLPETASAPLADWLLRLEAWRYAQGTGPDTLKTLQRAFPPTALAYHFATMNRHLNCLTRALIATLLIATQHRFRLGHRQKTLQKVTKEGAEQLLQPLPARCTPPVRMQCRLRMPWPSARA